MKDVIMISFFKGTKQYGCFLRKENKTKDFIKDFLFVILADARKQFTKNASWPKVEELTSMVVEDELKPELNLKQGVFLKMFKEGKDKELVDEILT